MVCTGDTLVYGVQIYLTDAVKYILKFAKSNIDKESYDILSNNIKNKDSYEVMEYTKMFFKKLNLSIEIIRPKCCLYDEKYTESDYSKVYLGIELYENSNVSRFNIDKFSTFEEYEKISSEDHLVLFLPCSAKAELNEKESKKVHITNF